MKLFDILLRPLGKSQKAGLVSGTVMLLLFIPAAIYMCTAFELPLAAMIALLVCLSAGFYRMKLYMSFIQLPVIWHIISGLISAFAFSVILRYADAGSSEQIYLSVSVGMFALFVLEIILSLILKAVSGEPNWGKFPKALAAFLPLLFTWIVFIPSETYFINKREFLFVYFDFAPHIFIKMTVFVLLAATAACTLGDKPFRFLTGITVGLTLCVYGQYVFMNGALPTFAGDKADWDSMGASMAVNAVVWCVLLLLPIVYILVSDRAKPLAASPAGRNIHLFVSSFIGGVQLITLAVLILTSEHSLFNHETYMLDSTEQFVVSGKKNIITIILDASDRHYFDDEMERNPEKFEFLKDFTYYTNACMMYDSTILSIPQMLSGAEELPETTIEDWLDSTWKSERCESFYTRLHEADYKVNVFGDFCFYNDPFCGKIDNCVYAHEEDVTIDRSSLYQYMDQLTEYRAAPLALKRFLEPNSTLNAASAQFKNRCLYNNVEFLSELDLKTSDSDKNYFIVEHVNGTHLIGGRTQDCVDQSMDILTEYVRQLKALGLYDDSVIIITGDHGAHYKPDNFPIFYIKTPGAEHDSMQYSDAPIHHLDYLATCIDAADLEKDTDGDLFGRSIFDIGEDEQRERLVFQRYGFEYTGTIDFKKCTSQNHSGAAYGYYFTGDREDLVRRESEGPPDILIELDSGY